MIHERLASFESVFVEHQRRIAFLDLLLKEHLADPDKLTLADIRVKVDTFMFAGKL
jgi:hypothetical protein